MISLKKLLSEQSPEKSKKSAPEQPAGGETSKELKIDIPDTPFEPDLNQVMDRLSHILKQWQVKKYPSDEYRWKSYYKDILQLISQVKGEADEI